jgi:hypothetical protein
MTRRTGDGLSQRIFSRGQSAIFSGKIAAGKSERSPAHREPSKPTPLLTFHRKLHRRPDRLGWNGRPGLLHLRITCAKLFAAQQ